MARLYVGDTNAIIGAFPSIFRRPPTLSTRSQNLVVRAFQSDYRVRLSIPSVVFIELYDKWCRQAEASRTIYYEIFVTARDSEVIEIRELDAEIVEIMTSFDDSIVNLESHDKIALAAAVALRAPLITSDRRIGRYVTKTHVIPEVIF
jgi:hypothetical protein